MAAAPRVRHGPSPRRGLSRQAMTGKATRKNYRFSWRTGCQPRHGGRRPTIHDFAVSSAASRRWRVCTRHDAERAVRNARRFGYSCASPKRRSVIPDDPIVLPPAMRRRATMTAAFGVQTGSLHVMAGADPPSTSCRAGLRKVVDGLPAQAVAVWADHAPNGAVIVARRHCLGPAGPIAWALACRAPVRSPDAGNTGVAPGGHSTLGSSNR